MLPRTRLIAALIAILVVGVSWYAAAHPRRDAPVQPIDFSHRVHAGTDAIACELCHSGARRSAFAGVPPVERCMGCHRYVLTRHPDVENLRRLWDAGKSIPWVKVYALPRVAHFTHEAHVLAHVACETCHGDVRTMDRIERVVDLTMGWCVQCHRERRASVDCLTCHY